ncbi:IS200/IS605 family transposase [Paenibacillus albidus]|uniref:IS200/IS605 family transposase n=1 Tax=Paenibacillus albidus TaxID=2041023 RepID=A0A917CL23_9BACL|nr:IS200/IS605 family transposase [Paenibacillus albidus]GGF91023.1 IS200/IS605 family transposase [Paenibacillus albidus]
MANKSYSLAHTKWMCKYHIVFTPKYRRKEIYNQVRRDLIEIFKRLCKYKGVEIIEGHMMPDHKYGNRKFWAEGYDVSTVGLNEATVAKYIREQEAHDQAIDKLSVKEYEDPFSSDRSKKK